MALSWRTSVLADRHRALGSKLEDWNGMGTAWTYAHDMALDHVAIRTKAGLMDVSGLKKLYLTGPHAAAILHQATTRDVTKIYPGKCAYACMLNEAGHFIEDCILYRLGPNTWMVVHGSGAGHETLASAVVGRNAALVFDDDLHDLSLQGPLAVEFLAKHVPAIRHLNYFHHTPALLFGRPVVLSRTGYSGERGYEIFCKGEDAGLIWDTVLQDGKSLGIVPTCFATLDMLRVESYLLFYPYDMSQMYPFEKDAPGDTLWELGLDFTVSPGKTDFRGADQHYRLKGKERFRIFGLLAEDNAAADMGDPVYAGDRKVGVVTCAMYSTLTKKSMALARLTADAAVHGKRLEIRGKNLKGPAMAHTLPFDDPQKKKRMAVG
jgi:glycine cleavage system T protein (aminomethyltransferase)